MPPPLEPQPTPSAAPRTAVLVTGALGLIGRQVLRALSERPGDLTTIVAADLREPDPSERMDGVTYAICDVRSPALGALLKQHGIDTVVHLAAVVTPRPGDTRDTQYEVDVLGTRNVLGACAGAGVRKLVYTSSGAAYGYDPENGPLLDEDAELRGNEEFAYAWHKRLVEADLATARTEHPTLEQLVFRVSTVLGRTVKNQITAMFERPVVIGLRGVDTPFCFIWDEDVAACIARGVRGPETGTFNLTGDGVMTLREVATALGRRYIGVPEPAVKAVLGLLGRYGLAPYGPEQTLFLRHRPVLSNARLKGVFGFVPSRTSRQAFEDYRRTRTAA